MQNGGMLPVVYLHGFASGPTSRKARFFKQQLEGLGHEVAIPALEGHDFEHMTITSQLELTRETTKRDCLLMGSSMGGYIAALRASETTNVKGAILLAPAFYFVDRWEVNLGPEVAAAWRQAGRRQVFHHARQQMEWIGYGIVEDARRYDPAPQFHAPGLILHGTRDDVVPVEHSLRYAAAATNIGLRQFESGHELTEVLPELWDSARVFLREV